MTAPLLQEHPLRQSLNDEAHARPSVPVHTGSRLSALVLFGGDTTSHRAALLALTQQLGLPEPGSHPHYVGEHAGLTLRWDSHTEFTRYSLLLPDSPADPFAESPLSHLPAGWLGRLPGQLLVAIHAAVVPRPEEPVDLMQVADQHFAGHDLIGSELGDGRGLALTDLQLHPDPHLPSGASRLLLLDGAMSERQCGRMLQRLLEIETYRMLALLGLPVAKALLPQLADMEARLSRLTRAIRQPESDDRQLLDEMTELAAELEGSLAASSYRFSAASAYYAIIERRIAELRERRQSGLQPFREFVERRLAPAIDTCQSVSRRQEQLSLRLQRSTALLRTRVDVSSEAQRHGLLASMNRRAALQLRLQQTVEGLSVAVLTYYIVSLIGYAAKALHALGLHVTPELITGGAIPLVAATVAFGLHRFQARQEEPRPPAA